METAVGMSTALVLAVDQQTGYGYGVRGMTAARGNGHRRADLLRLKSVIESVTQVRVAAGHSAWHRQIPHQRALCGMYGAFRVGGERAGVWPEMRTRRAGGGTFRRMHACFRVRKW